jgi:hypothetical protein
MTMRDQLAREVAALGLPVATDSAPVVTDADIAAFPKTVQRYLRFMGVVGRPRDWSFSLGFTGRFRRSRSELWMKCEAWQYNCRLSVARIFHIRIRFVGVIPVLARDTYVGGRDRMPIRILDLITVGDGTGEEFDIGELVTYLNDGIVIAPSLLLAPEVRWSSVDESSFDVALTDRDHSDPADPKRLVRARWTTPVEGRQQVGDRPLLTGGQALWHPPDGEFAYIDLKPIAESLVFNGAAKKSAVDRARADRLTGAPLESSLRKGSP